MAYTPYYNNGWQSGEEGNTPITPDALNHIEEGLVGAVSKSGDTMTGNLNINRAVAEESSIRFGSEAGTSDQYISIHQNAWGILYYMLPVRNASDGTLKNSRFRFFEYSPNTDGTRTGYAEIYLLPVVDAGRTSSSSYDILTTKSPVTVAQGGTGATKAADARANLVAAPCIRLDSSMDTPARIFEELKKISVHETATIMIATAAFNALTGKSFSSSNAIGTVYRDSTNNFYFDLMRINSQYRYGFRAAVSTSAITPDTVYQYTGTALS